MGEVKSSDMEKAVEWLSKAQEARLKPEIITYNAVINACARSGDMDQAAECSSKAHEVGLNANIIS